MNIFGLTITRQKAVQPNAVPVSERGWWRIFESFPGAWQRNITVDYQSVLTFHAIYACITLIASDIAKLCVRLMQKDGDGIWTEVFKAAYSPVLRKPNRFQNRIQFWENWILSKLTRGNTYVLKERDLRNVVVALYVLDPNKVTPMVTDDGSVFYNLRADNISGVRVDVMVPASEIIHDRWNCLYHPLIGTSPIVACGIAATQGMSIQTNQTNFFNNRSMPGGILTAPGNIADNTAQRLKDTWETNYGGENVGKVAVLGDGLKFEPMAMTSQEAQAVEQLKWTAEVVCSVFHVPGYKVGVGTVPANSNVQSLNLEYYSQALQRLIEDAELCLDEGLGLAEDVGTEFDIDNLLRMDTISLISAEKEAVGAGIKSPNEARKRLNLPPTDGGDGPYLQQQNYSLAALAKRDAQEDPFKPSASSTPPAAPANDDEIPAEAAKALVVIKAGLAR